MFVPDPGGRITEDPNLSTKVGSGFAQAVTVEEPVFVVVVEMGEAVTVGPVVTPIQEQALE